MVGVVALGEALGVDWVTGSVPTCAMAHCCIVKQLNAMTEVLVRGLKIISLLNSVEPHLKYMFDKYNWHMPWVRRRPC